MRLFIVSLPITILMIALIGNMESVYTDSNSKYVIHVQLEIRNAEEQLISITESKFGKHMEQEIPDYVFNSIIGQKETITINEIVYEKVQFEVSMKHTDMKNLPDARTYDPYLQFILCGESESNKSSCMELQSAKYWVAMDENDIITSKWTVLRIND